MKTYLEVTPCSSSGILDASAKESFSWVVKKDAYIATSLLSLKQKLKGINGDDIRLRKFFGNSEKDKR